MTTHSDSHGSGGGWIGKGFAAVLLGIFIVVLANGIYNRTHGKDFLDGMGWNPSKTWTGGGYATQRPPVTRSNSWADQGQKEVCRGVIRGMTFKCISPSSGRLVDCQCGD